MGFPSKSLVKASTILALVTASASSFALSLTLNTAGLDANSTLTMAASATETMSAVGITMSATGYATSLGNNSAGLAQFNIPVTQLTTNIGLLPPSITPTAAQTMGSFLTFTAAVGPLGGGGTASIGNLNINFTTDTISGQLISSTGTTNLNLFTFSVTQPLQFNFTNGISLTEGMGNLYLTPAAGQALSNALGLNPVLENTFSLINLGSIEATIVPWIRTTPLSSIHAVPEPSTYAMLALGLVGIALASRRRNSAA